MYQREEGKRGIVAHTQAEKNGVVKCRIVYERYGRASFCDVHVLNDFYVIMCFPYVSC